MKQAVLILTLALLPAFATARLRSDPPRNLKILDENLLSLSARAIEIAVALHTQEDPSAIEGKLYVDEPDAALFVRIDDYCIGAFRATTPNTADWFQNLDPFNGSICSPSGEYCTTRRGFQQACTDADYAAELEADIRDCKGDCPDCEVVLTGHSQGGSIAAIQAVALSDLDPTIITTGSPGTIVGDCAAINEKKYYRFVNAIVDSNGDLDYDPVPYLNWNTDQMGHLFIMGDDKENVAYYGQGDGPSLFDFGWRFAAHAPAKYVSRLRSYQDQGSIRTSGWEEGFACNVDEECMYHCGLRDSENVSGVCTSKLRAGQWCINDSACQSEHCDWFTCT